MCSKAGTCCPSARRNCCRCTHAGATACAVPAAQSPDRLQGTRHALPVALPAHGSSPCGAWGPAGVLSSTVGRRGPLAPSSCSCRASWMRVTSNTQLLVGWRVAPWRGALLAAHAGRRGRVSRTGAPAAGWQQGAASSSRRRSAAWSGWCACVMHSISCWPHSETLSCRSHQSACVCCCLQDDRCGATSLQSWLLA